jgi:RHS repeat-associated protein
LNTPRKIAQPTSATLAWRWDADPFGSAAPNQNPAGLGTFAYNLRFPGQYYQAETGLNQNYFRDFDPLVGRYVESDPIGLHGGINTYGYAGQNPLWSVDLTGTSGTITIPLPDIPIPGWLSWFGSRALGPIAMALSLSGDTPQHCPEECPPCKTASGKIVPLGTIAFRPLDTPPPGKIEHGIEGPHYNIYKANQYPRNSPSPCDCFWQPLGAVEAAALPPGAMPIEPFLNSP